MIQQRLQPKGQTLYIDLLTKKILRVYSYSNINEAEKLRTLLELALHASFTITWQELFNYLYNKFRLTPKKLNIDIDHIKTCLNFNKKIQENMEAIEDSFDALSFVFQAEDTEYSLKNAQNLAKKVLGENIQTIYRYEITDYQLSNLLSGLCRDDQKEKFIEMIKLDQRKDLRVRITNALYFLQEILGNKSIQNEWLDRIQNTIETENKKSEYSIAM